MGKVCESVMVSRVLPLAEKVIPSQEYGFMRGEKQIRRLCAQRITLPTHWRLVRSNCEATLANCSWNGKAFSCCDYFRPMDTEIGTCYAINTIQGRERNPTKFPMISNRTAGPGAIKFNVLVPGNVYVLNEEDVPSVTTLGSDVLAVGSDVFHRSSTEFEEAKRLKPPHKTLCFKGLYFDRTFPQWVEAPPNPQNPRRYITIRNIENDAGARLIAPEKRKCRYTDENPLQVYRHYSYSACTVQCRKEAQLKHCNCTNFFMPNTPEDLKCDIKGIICLNDHLNDISVLKARWSSRPGLYCDCFPSCTEAEISVVKDFKVTTTEPYATVQIELSVLPSERYRRNVVRGVLDLVVSTGGTGGLFLGASILSFVELIYILLLRPFRDIYSQRGSDSDPWYRHFGNRRVEDNRFVPNRHWSFK
ncbi:Sodium channel protein Nach [Eumeta japonica]|uniref:Sodium channel protein Nach n=1 Tax=Eumeta variegata TaxID=151549 RepID=A0A4C1XQS2_EUMVA|nr:Sodium channel protein Nach [Eumeta japonica]